MGIDYYLVDHKRKEIFELGKGGHAFDEEVLHSRCDREEMIARLLEYWNVESWKVPLWADEKWADPVFVKTFFGEVADSLIWFLDRCDWKPVLLNDCDASMDEIDIRFPWTDPGRRPFASDMTPYLVVGTRYEYPPEQMAAFKEVEVKP